MDRARIRALDIVDELAIQVALDSVWGISNLDVVPAPGLDRIPHRSPEHGFSAVYRLFQGILGVAPAANVPPNPVFAVFAADGDQESFSPAEFASLKSERVEVFIGGIG